LDRIFEYGSDRIFDCVDWQIFGVVAGMQVDDEGRHARRRDTLPAVGLGLPQVHLHRQDSGRGHANDGDSFEHRILGYGPHRLLPRFAGRAAWIAFGKLETRGCRRCDGHHTMIDFEKIPRRAAGCRPGAVQDCPQPFFRLPPNHFLYRRADAPDSPAEPRRGGRTNKAWLACASTRTCTSTRNTRGRRAGISISSISPPGRAARASAWSAPATSPIRPGAP